MRIERRNTTRLELEAAFRREHEKLRALQDIGAALGSTMDLEEILDLVLVRISRVLEAERSAIYLLDDEAHHTWTRVIEGRAPEKITIRPRAGLIGWVAQSGQTLNVDHVENDDRFSPEIDRTFGILPKSVLCVPMKNYHGRTLGVVEVINKRSGPFNGEDERLLTTLSAQSAVTIENSRLFVSLVNKNIELLDTKEQLERKVRELDVLFEIAQLSAQSTSLKQLVEGVLLKSLSALQAEACCMVHDEGAAKADIYFVSAVDWTASPMRHLSLPMEYSGGFLESDGEPLTAYPATADPHYRSELSERLGFRPKSVLSVPLRWEGGKGVLEMLNKRSDLQDFSEEDLRFANVIGAHVASMIGIARVRDKQRRQERLTTVGQLLSGVLHDLKSPLMVISGFTEQLLSEPDPRTRHEYANIIRKQITLINEMTKETLAFARGDQSLFIRKVYLGEFFEEVGQVIKRILEGRDIAFELRLIDKGVAKFDQYKILRVVQNLVRNSREALQQSGGNADGMKGRIVLTVDRRPLDRALIIQVEDNGPGIPSEIKDRMFENFVSHGKAEGTGLGLAIVHKIVQDHNGTVDFESEPGRTVFTVTLPQPEALTPTQSTIPPPLI